MIIVFVENGSVIHIASNAPEDVGSAIVVDYDTDGSESASHDEDGRLAEIGREHVASISHETARHYREKADGCEERYGAACAAQEAARKAKETKA